MMKNNQENSARQIEGEVYEKGGGLLDRPKLGNGEGRAGGWRGVVASAGWCEIVASAVHHHVCQARELGIDA